MLDVSKSGVDFEAKAMILKKSWYEGEKFEGTNENTTFGIGEFNLAAKFKSGFSSLFKLGYKAKAAFLSLGQHVDGYSSTLDVNLDIGTVSSGLMVEANEKGVGTLKGTKGAVIGVDTKVGLKKE
jgi:hypothetical protein